MKKKQEDIKKKKDVLQKKNIKHSKRNNLDLCKLLTGLSYDEHKKLKNLKNIQSNGIVANDRKNISTQQTITFEKMYRDGVCKVEKNYYTKMIEFFDINYYLLDEHARKNIISAYAQFINYFDPDVKFQLFLFNRHVNEDALIDRFDIDLQEDGFDDIRKEYSDMLKNLSHDGNNGVIKGKYIVFGVKAENVEDARTRFEGIEEDIVNNLHDLGTDARILNGKKRLEIIYQYFNQDKMLPFEFSFKEMSEAGISVKDYIAPQGFDFRFPGRYKSGHMFGCIKYLDITAPKINDELIKRILDIDENITVSIHMNTVDPIEAVKSVKRALSDVQSTKINEQKKAVRGGYDMDILPTDILIYEKNTLNLLDDLIGNNEKYIWTTILIGCFGRTKKEMQILEQKVTGIVEQANCRFEDLQYTQEAAMNSLSPIGKDYTGVGRHFTTKNMSALIPFCTQELFQNTGFYYGLNAISKNMIIADRKKLRTPNGVILGTPGSGKSFSAKREIVGCYLETTDDIIICDPEGEYYPVVNALGGQVINLATNSPHYLNPMDIRISSNSRINKESLNIKSDFIITLCDLVVGKNGLESDEKGIIDKCIRNIYERFFNDPDPDKMPILEDLYNELNNYEPGEFLPPEIAMEAKGKAIHIANSIVLYVHGSQNYFNHRTNVDSQNRIICFDIRDLSKQLKNLGMLIVQDTVWNRVSYNRERKIATRYYCDEFHLLLKEKQTAQYCVEIWKRFRKWGGIPTALTQNVGEFLKSDEIEGILGNSDFVYLLNLNDKDQKILADKLELSEKQLEYVTNADQGCGLIIYNGIVIPFIDHYPTDTMTYKIMSTKPEDAPDVEEVFKDKVRVS